MTETQDIEIVVFAALKSYFEPGFRVKVNSHTVFELREQLAKHNPEAKPMLWVSRFAQNQVFLSLTDTLNFDVPVFIVPPSSGG